MRRRRRDIHQPRARGPDGRQRPDAVVRERQLAQRRRAQRGADRRAARAATPEEGVRMASAESALTLRAVEPADLSRLDEIRRAAFAPIYASFRSLVGPAIAAVALAEEEEGQRRH